MQEAEGASGALAVDAEAVFPAIVGFNVLEARVGRVAHLGAADVGEAGVGEFLFHSLVVPHPQMTGASEDGGGDGSHAARGRHFAEPAFLHEAGACRGSGVSRVEADELFEVRQDEAKGTAGTKIGEYVFNSNAELVKRHVLEHVRAIDRFCGTGRHREALDDVAVLDVFGIGRKTFFDQQRGEKRKAALQPKGWTGIEVLPCFWSTHATAKLHIPVIHGRIIHSVGDGFRAWESGNLR
jgi:hypothetical protein